MVMIVVGMRTTRLRIGTKTRIIAGIRRGCDQKDEDEGKITVAVKGYEGLGVGSFVCCRVTILHTLYMYFIYITHTHYIYIYTQKWPFLTTDRVPAYFFPWRLLASTICPA